VAHLVEAGGVPGLGDELGVPQDRVVRELFEQRRVGQRGAVRGPVEDGREVEAEPVDVVLGRQDSTKSRTTGWLQLTVLPVPLKL
jgi:hypothetical protein